MLLEGNCATKPSQDDSSDDFTCSSEFKKIQERVERYKNKDVIEQIEHSLLDQ
jgi:hypothetical protein